MSNKRNTQNPAKGFKSVVPKAPVERDEQGNFLRTSVHTTTDGKHWYSPNLGWRKTRQYTPHTLLNSLMMKLGLASMYQN